MADADHDDAALDAYRDTFSDGSPVSLVVGPPTSTGKSVPRNAYEHGCDIPWLPNRTGNDGYAEFGPIPPGCKVAVLDPPHRRMWKTRDRVPGRDLNFEALKKRLREAERRTTP